jgi:hypothetical protein
MKTMPIYPPSELSKERLRRAGWCMDVSTQSPSPALVWRVKGFNGENLIDATGKTAAEAWYKACLAAEAVGMLRR